MIFQSSCVAGEIEDCWRILGSFDASQDQGFPVAGLNPGFGQTDFACSMGVV